MMINGAVNLMRLPAVTIDVIDNSGHLRATEANLDTGFSGDLTLPKTAIEQLGLLFVATTNFRIASGTMTLFNTYEGTIRWHDSLRNVAVLESENFPLLGVGLLWENNLSIDFTHGGNVTITELFDL